MTSAAVPVFSPQAIRLTAWQVEQMAYAMYRANVADYALTEGRVLAAWADPAISEFWTLQALQAVEFLNTALATE